jgi:uncharacterized protein (TIGR03790 family)
MDRCLLALLLALAGHGVTAQDLTPSRLGLIFNVDDPGSVRVGHAYAAARGIPSENLVGVHLPRAGVLSPAAFAAVRDRALGQLPSRVQSLVLVWTKPWAVGCMSVTSAFAIGYSDAYCTLGCTRTPRSPLYDSNGWLPADTVGWWPAMLLPTDDTALATALIARGIAADAGIGGGVLYLTRTPDTARNVRAATYGETALLLGRRIRVVELATPVAHDIPEALGYFTGAAHVEELSRIRFLPGAIADHLTSSGGVLEGGTQMSALAWLRDGATASYGSVSEPCSYPEKFPSTRVLFDHYTHGETALESYWKSVAMPGQGLFIGDPLSRPFPVRH